MNAILAIAELRPKSVLSLVSVATIAALITLASLLSPLAAEAQSVAVSTSAGADDTMAILNSARAVAQGVYTEIRTKREVYGWEVAGPRDRMPLYCIDQCGCLTNKFVPALRAQGFEAVTVVLRPRANSMGIRIRGQNLNTMFGSSYSYHMMTMIKASGQWFVLDPLVIGNTHLEPLKVWEQRLESPVDYSRR